MWLLLLALDCSLLINSQNVIKLIVKEGPTNVNLNGPLFCRSYIRILYQAKSQTLCASTLSLSVGTRQEVMEDNTYLDEDYHQLPRWPMPLASLSHRDGPSHHNSYPRIHLPFIEKLYGFHDGGVIIAGLVPRWQRPTIKEPIKINRDFTSIHPKTIKDHGHQHRNLSTAWWTSPDLQPNLSEARIRVHLYERSYPKWFSKHYEVSLTTTSAS